jgi:hypothetical protein
MPMDGYPHDPQLRARIQAFSPDEPGVVFPFSARLARQNGWTRAFAHRVIEEYRRFVYLAMTAGHPVSPSEQVDQAWHLHLTYTRSYWERLCGEVLGRPLHHDPTRGGAAEASKFDDWYARTLDSYRRAFGHAPPPDVWPPPAERFAPAARTRQVSDATHWIIRKPRLRRGPRTAAAAIGALLVTTACTGSEAGAAAAVLAALGVLVGVALSQSSPPESALARKQRADGGATAMDGTSHSGAADCDSGGGGDCGDGGAGGDGGGCGGGGCGGG